MMDWIFFANLNSNAHDHIMKCKESYQELLGGEGETCSETFDRLTKLRGYKAFELRNYAVLYELSQMRLVPVHCVVDINLMVIASTPEENCFHTEMTVLNREVNGIDLEIAQVLRDFFDN
jgi:hypothetical protein